MIAQVVAQASSDATRDIAVALIAVVLGGGLATAINAWRKGGAEKGSLIVQSAEIVVKLQTEELARQKGEHEEDLARLEERHREERRIFTDRLDDVVHRLERVEAERTQLLEENRRLRKSNLELATRLEAAENKLHEMEQQAELLRLNAEHRLEGNGGTA